MKSSIRVTRGGNSISFRGPIANRVFQAMAAEASKPKTKFKSIAVWPADAGLCLGNTANESDDTHYSREQADAVCLALRTRGFGGDGKIFPLSTRVEEIPAPELE